MLWINIVRIYFQSARISVVFTERATMIQRRTVQATRDHLLSGADAQRRYALAGSATLTLHSLKSGHHHVYSVKASDDLRLWFVSLLVDGGVRRPVYLGQIYRRDLRFVHGRRSSIPFHSEAALAFRHWWGLLERGLPLPAKLQVWSNGSCARCGRELTDEASVQRGVGPVCWNHVSCILDVRPRLAALASALDADGYASPLWVGAPVEVTRGVDEAYLAVMLRCLSQGGVDEVAQVLHLLRSLDADREAVRHLAAVAGALAVHAEGGKAARKRLREELADLAPPRLAGWWLPTTEEITEAAAA